MSGSEMASASALSLESVLEALTAVASVLKMARVRGYLSVAVSEFQKATVQELSSGSALGEP